MKAIIIIFLLATLGLNAQTALYNGSGSIRIHQDGQLGFHTDLINDSAFDENLGLVGFYGTNTPTISGAFVPVFFDVEVAADNHALLQTGIDVQNNTNFIIGDLITPRNQSDVTYNFLQDAFYNGESDLSKIDGYAAVLNQQNVTFPVGDSDQLRSLILNSEDLNLFAKCAYFFEDPNFPSTFPSGFSTNIKPRALAEVGTTEFWRLEGNVASTISISWNGRSDIAMMTDDVNTIIPVGWSKAANQWVSLGATAAAGDLTQGFVTSQSFTPDDYEVITFGTLGEPTELLTLDNYLVTPNGDGANDFLFFPELEQSPNNHLTIFDRNGTKVFDQQNYTNQFAGVSNVNNFVINREAGLAVGVYFYVVSLDDLGLEFQGFLYLSR